MRFERVPFSASVRAAIGCVAVMYALPASAQLRIVDYNIAQNYDIANDPGGLDVIFDAIGDELRNGFARPIDVITMQELHESGSDAILVASILNSLYGTSSYMAATVPMNAQTLGNGLPGLVYNSSTVSLVNTLAFGTVSTIAQPRSSLRYELRPMGYDEAANFFLYSNHYKSDEGTVNQARRNVEAQGVRANSDALGEGTHAIYAGDFNVYRSSEPMFQTLLAAGPGQAFDPITDPIYASGSWSVPSQGEIFKPIHTQSPATVEAFPGQSHTGMDDRFDFQLVTGEFLDGEGLSQLTGSYRAFGNDGSHQYAGAITTGTWAPSGVTNAPGVLAALAASSDHLPVVADYQIPAKLGVQVAATPMSVTLGASISLAVTVSNLASVVAVNGADELDYTLSASGDLSGMASGIDNAMGGGNIHLVMLDTATPGLKSGVITVSSSSQGAANSLFTMPISYEVVSPVFLAADFNEDGMVNGEDLTTWQSNFGLAGVAMKDDGDADLDGDVDGADFLTWQQQLGGAPLVPTATTVPEPSAWGLMMFACCVASKWRRSIGARSVTGG